MNPVTHENVPVPAGLAATAKKKGLMGENLRTWAPAAVLLVLFWILIFNQQRLEWTVNVVYAYGWAVPFLSGYLLWERSRVRPAPSQPLPGAIVGGIAVALLLSYLPLRVIQEANPDWVRVNWAICLAGAVLTLTAFASTGGWRYVKHFSFPVLFCFTALPWPVWFGDGLIQGLQRANAAICAELLTWGGMPAIAEGNLVQIAGHWLNVEEACSGMRSLQTAFMMSLFLGEFYRMGLVRRAVLMLSSFAVALLVNVGRTVTLAVATSRGKGEELHDTVGNIAMVLCLVGLWLLSDFLNRGNKPALPNAETSSLALGRRPFPTWLAVSGILWLGTTEVFNVAWYSSYEKNRAGLPVWEVNWPKTNPTFKQGVFGDITKAILKYNEGEIADWTVDSGSRWQMYYLRWYPGRVSKHLSRSHHPTVCLPASGLKLISETGLWECEVNGVRFPFSTYVFSQGPNEVYVFHALIEDRSPDPNSPIVYGQVGASERIDSVLRHERNLGQRVVGVSLTGPTSPMEARETVSSVLKKLIVKESPALVSSITP